MVCGHVVTSWGSTVTYPSDHCTNLVNGSFLCRLKYVGNKHMVLFQCLLHNFFLQITRNKKTDTTFKLLINAPFCPKLLLQSRQSWGNKTLTYGLGYHTMVHSKVQLFKYHLPCKLDNKTKRSSSPWIFNSKVLQYMFLLL